jgi:2-oxoisovalerate dehydrogenase E1 component
MDGIRIDGNNILEVYNTIQGIRDYCVRYQKPYLVECMTFRMRGHEEASGTKYIPDALFDLWKHKDPIKTYEQYLIEQNILTELSATDIRNELTEKIESELKEGFHSKPFIPNTEEELNDVYAKPQSTSNKAQAGRFKAQGLSNGIKVIDNSNQQNDDQKGTTSNEQRLLDSIKQALYQSLQQHPNLILMGQDIAEYGGAFKITEGFVQEFGKEKIRNTPICESAIIGAALGLSIEGYKSVVEMQFADFITMGFNQVVNNLAKAHYRWGQNADVVIRMPTGGGVGAGPFHSQSNEAWFAHTPGLKVVYPSSPIDAKGLLIAAINDPNPILFFEHKALYRSISGQVPEEYYEIEIGKARHLSVGEDVSIITYGMGVHWALEYAEKNKNISIDITDLRTLLPLDYEAIKMAVARTGKVLILHEDTLTGGIGGEITAWIAEHCFDTLDAPPMRCASLDTPVPFNIDLEKNFMAYSRLGDCIEKLIGY